MVCSKVPRRSKSEEEYGHEYAVSRGKVRMDRYEWVVTIRYEYQQMTNRSKNNKKLRKRKVEVGEKKDKAKSAVNFAGP